MFLSPYTELPTLTSRPPTPPQDTEQDIVDAINFLSSDIELDKNPILLTAHNISSDTPPSSSPLTSAAIDNVNVTKKVEFTSTPIYHCPADIDPGSSPKSSPARSRLLPPPKSILKLGTSSPLPTPEDTELQCYFSSDVPQSFAKMLDSVITQLESQSVYSRLDAYLMVNSALMSYEDLPDHDELTNRIDIFQRFIVRDTASREQEESTDVQIAIQALKLAARLLADLDFLPATTHELHASMLDRCIAILENAGRPKSIVKMSLGLLAQQQLPSSILTSARAERLVTALQTIDARYPGNSIVTTRLLIYRRLVRQAQNTMSGRMRDWLQHLLHGMISDHPETRMRSVETCHYASGAYGGKSGAATILHNLLETEVEVSTGKMQSYFEHFAMRVAELSRAESSRLIVPQIWSGIVLFHRSTKSPIYRWQRFRQWLVIMQSCLVASDSDLRCHAHSAWRKLIYVIRPSGNVPQSLVALLMKPMRAGLARTGDDRKSRELRRLGLDGYYNLLHYALRPGQSLDQLDQAWKYYVEETIATMAQASSKGRYVACRVLHGLLTPNTGVWNPEAAMEDAAIQPDDLPRLDVRWVRSRLASILPLIELILPSGLAPSNSAEHVKAVQDLWSMLLQSVVDAGAHEVRSSAELKAAIVDLLNSFRRMLKRNSDDGLLCDALGNIQQATFNRLNLISLHEPFVEHDLRTSQAIPTNAAQPETRSQVKRVTPVLYALSYTSLYSVSGAQRLLEDHCTTKITPAAKAQLLSDIWKDMAEANREDDGGEGRLGIFCAVASTISDVLTAEHEPAEHDAKPFGHLGVSFLVAGCTTLAGGDASATVIARLTIAVLLNAPGNMKESCAIAESISESLLSAPTWTCMGNIIAFIRSSLGALDSISGRLSGENHFSFLKLVNKACVLSCEGALLTETDMMSLEDIYRLLSVFLKRYPDEQLAMAISSVEQAFLARANARLNATDATVVSSAQDFQYSTWWSFALSLLIRAYPQTQRLPKRIEDWMIAGSNSVSLDIVRQTITFWKSNPYLSKSCSLLVSEAVTRAMQRIAVHDAAVDREDLRQGLTHDQQAAGFASAQKPTRSAVQDELVHEQTESRITPIKLRPSHLDSQADFAVIPLPSTPVVQESQHLTSHQREVRARQSVDARAHPELSSSPIPVFAQQTAGVVANHEAELSTPVVVEPSPADRIAEGSQPQESPSIQQSAKSHRKKRSKTSTPSQLSTPSRNADERSIRTASEPSIARDPQPSTRTSTRISSGKAKVDSSTAQLQQELATSFEVDQIPAAEKDNKSVENHSIDTSISRKSSRKRKRSQVVADVDKAPPSKRVASDNAVDTDEDVIVVVSRPAMSQTSFSPHSQSSQSQHDGVKSASASRSKRGRRKSRQMLKQSSTGLATRSPTAAHEPDTAIQLVHTATSVSPMQDSMTALAQGPAAVADMMRHLRQALEDCKKVALDAKQEREMDDLLYEFRQANHEAGRRGREAS